MPLDGFDALKSDDTAKAIDNAPKLASEGELLNAVDEMRFGSRSGSTFASADEEMDEDIRYGRTPLNLLIPVESLRMPGDAFGKHYGYTGGEVDLINTMVQACEYGRRESFVDGEDVNYGNRKRQSLYDHQTGRPTNEKYVPHTRYESRGQEGEDKMVWWLKEKYSAVPVISEHHQDDARMESTKKRFVVQPLEGSVYKDDREAPNRMNSFTMSIAYQERDNANAPWKTELSMAFDPHQMRALCGVGTRGKRAMQFVPTCLASYRGTDSVKIEAEEVSSNLFSKDKPYKEDKVGLLVANADSGVMAATKENLEAKLQNSPPPEEFHERNATELLSAVAMGQRKAAVIIADPNAPAWETEAGLHVAELAGAKMLKTNLAELTGRKDEKESPPVYIAADSQKLLTTLKQMVKDQYRMAEREEERGR